MFDDDDDDVGKNIEQNFVLLKCSCCGLNDYCQQQVHEADG